MTFPPKVWTGVLRRLKAKLPEFTHEAWIVPLAIGPSTPERLVVLCPSTFHRDRVRNSFHSLISEAFADELGHSIAVEFDVREIPDATGTPHAPDASEPVSVDRRPMTPTKIRTLATRTGSTPAHPPRKQAHLAHRALPVATSAASSPAGGGAGAARLAGAGAAPLADAMSQATMRLGMRSSGLIGPGSAPARSGSRAAGKSALVSDTKSMGFVQPELPYSFDNFVVGPCNSLAREAAFAVAGGQQLALKQLYLAAAPGLGKTHLAKAVAVEVARRSGRPVRYANAEVFTNEFVAALRTKETAEFKRRYRPGEGLLVLEDIQFLAAKRATQLELFHSVQHVLDAGGRVLLTGDRLPRDIPEPRRTHARQLVAGASWPGSTCPTPSSGVRSCAQGRRRRRPAPDDCLDLLVDSTSGSVRDIEGVLIQVVTTARCSGARSTSSSPSARST